MDRRAQEENEEGRPRLACSTGTMPRGLGRRYHDLEAVFEVVKCLPVNLAELVLHPDWRPNIRPRSKQPDPWELSEAWEVDELASRIRQKAAQAEVRVCSVHANRDTGIFLGADDKADRRLGAEVLKNNCRVADAVGASLVVVHAWDTRATAIEARAAADTINTVAAEFGDITLAVENLPLSAEGWSQEQLMHTFDRMLEPRVGFTLDLSWSSLYDNFDQLLSLLPRVKNVHVQGRLVRDASQGKTLRPRAGNLVLETAISELAAQGYSGQWTLELNKAQAVADFVEAIYYLEDLLSGL